MKHQPTPTDTGTEQSAARRWPRLIRQPVEDVSACLHRLADRQHPMRALLLVACSIVVTWFVYVPIHEMLHVAGCVVTGGEVSELQVAPEYGGPLLAKVFPFVVSGGTYAGRLSGFDTHGSDLVYLATVFGPFVVSVFPGVWLIRLCTRRSRPLLMGPAFVLGLAPFTNLIGDYFEMGGIIVTRFATWCSSDGSTIAFQSLRSDDVFKTVGQLISSPAELGIGAAQSMAGAIAVVVLSALLAVMLALGTYWVGGLVAGWMPPCASNNAASSSS